jgi:transcriptional regulator NrdR family protein
MNCPACKKAKLHVRQVYSAGEGAETRNLLCPACGHRASSATFLIPREQVRDRNRSGIALAKGIMRGEVAVEIDDEQAAEG